MKFEVLYDPKAEKQLDRLPKDTARRILKKMKEVAVSGHGIEALKDAQYGFKVRVGDYRVLVDVTHKPNTIIVRYIGHRSVIYKRA
jgi:mRNA interferase RelE/StbE